MILILRNTPFTPVGNNILNQNAVEQLADFWIDGDGKAGSFSIDPVGQDFAQFASYGTFFIAVGTRTDYHRYYMVAVVGVTEVYKMLYSPDGVVDTIVSGVAGVTFENALRADLAPVGPTDVLRKQDIDPAGLSQVLYNVAYSNLSAGFELVRFTPVNTLSFRVSGYVNLRVDGGLVAQYQVTFTDTEGVLRTKTYNFGNLVDYYDLSFTFRVQGGTEIIIDVATPGAPGDTVLYDTLAVVEQFP